MRPSEGEDAETREEVEILIAGAVIQVAALAAFVEPVHPDRLQNLDELRVEELGMQPKVLATPGVHQFTQFEAHRASGSKLARAYRSGPLGPLRQAGR
jgi:hypothetical protein